LHEITEGFTIFSLKTDELALEEVVVINKPFSKILNEPVDNLKFLPDKSSKVIWAAKVNNNTF
jgi:hypothetical protein